MNICWKTYQIPKSWLTALITPIFMKGELNQCKNYREINLLHAGYKIYAKILNTRLSRIAETKLSEEQCGFRKGRSCTDRIFTTKLIIEQEVLERTNLPNFLTLFKSKLSFGKSQFYYIFIFHSFMAKIK
jgi:hypothetical protein